MSIDTESETMLADDRTREVAPREELPPPAPGRIRDAVEIMRRRYLDGDPEIALAAENARLRHDIAQALYDLRMAAGLTQKQLADRVGTSHSVISRLEDAGYEGHSLGMLRRIGKALGFRLELRFVPLEGVNSR